MTQSALEPESPTYWSGALSTNEENVIELGAGGEELEGLVFQRIQEANFWASTLFPRGPPSPCSLGGNAGLVPLLLSPSLGQRTSRNVPDVFLLAHLHEFVQRLGS